MQFTTWLLFSVVAFIAIVSPGPAILLSISNSFRFGIRKVVLSSLGNICGLFLLSAAAILGLGTVLKTSTTLFLIIKIIGAAYLIYLGVRQWRSKVDFFDDNEKRNNQRNKIKSNQTFFVEGFLIAMTNPKAILFFTALFPQFIHTDQLLIPQFLIMTFTFMAISFTALVSYGALAVKAKHWLSTGQRAKWFNRMLGSLFILIGVGLLQLKAVRNAL
jgi:threonine/homoserine/homoserine lactone efflux protein